MNEKKGKKDVKDVLISFTKGAGDTTKKVIKGFKEGYRESYGEKPKGRGKR